MLYLFISLVTVVILSRLKLVAQNEQVRRRFVTNTSENRTFNVLGISSCVVQKRFLGINFAKTQAVEMSNLTCRMTPLNVCNCLISRADLLNLTSRANRDEQRFGVAPTGF
jgi:hypothetical protein